MIPIHVALVPSYKDEYVNPRMVLRVAAALQMQLTRDFTPVWGIPAVVSPFMSLDQVPPASIPLLIVKPDLLAPRGHGFHLGTKGQPIGLVAGGPGWSLAASHELLEIVCDPQGKTKVIGESIADQHPKALTPTAKRHPYPQGQVAYLLEICDPCQKFHYTLNGFQVSDFVTPQYYEAGATASGQFSFTGKVTKPRQVPSNGYLTWYTSMPTAPIWQAINHGNDLRIGPLAVPAPAYSRHDLDYFSDFVSALDGLSQQKPKAAAAEAQARESARRYGAELAKELERIVDIYEAAKQPTAVLLTELLPVLRKLAYEKRKWKSYKKHPESLVLELNHLLPDGFQFRDGFPSRKQFRAVYTSLEKLSQGHAGLRLSKLVATTAIHGTTLG
jgi:hypothetical protein